MRKEPFNGPQKELARRNNHLDESVYCVVCGNIFVPARGRDCPTCKVAQMLKESERAE